MAELRLRISLVSLLRKEPSNCELFIYLKLTLMPGAGTTKDENIDLAVNE
jgi:hypothetical protein